MGAPTRLVGVGRADGNVVTEAAMAKMGLIGGWLAVTSAVRGGWARLVWGLDWLVSERCQRLRWPSTLARCKSGRCRTRQFRLGPNWRGWGWMARQRRGRLLRLGGDCVSLAGRRQWSIVSLVDDAEEEGNKKEIAPQFLPSFAAAIPQHFIQIAPETNFVAALL
ncbi:hypothetical protein TIFTF001_030235 [Ficus carica]|uniref:Uncharacterized protein n=1 Tax=Ficus carica TaxID=3494 RepID=A0AA88J3V7_FICCA|nr:hypothetical protein TIFTF001_030235 [Ficus carica]